MLHYKRLHEKMNARQSHSNFELQKLRHKLGIQLIEPNIL